MPAPTALCNAGLRAGSSLLDHRSPEKVSMKKKKKKKKRKRRQLGVGKGVYVDRGRRQSGS